LPPLRELTAPAYLVETPYWTDADQAELDVLVHTLTVEFDAHRQKCRACQPGPCERYEAWLAHERDCRICEGLAPLTFGWSCPERTRFLDEHRDCVRCLPCPHLQSAIREVLEWREARLLRSRAEALRAKQDAGEGER
jgi:hypothetical protein